MVNQVGLINILKRRWPDIEENYNIIPQVFTLLKDLGVISLRRVQQLMEVAFTHNLDGSQNNEPIHGIIKESCSKFKYFICDIGINRAIDVIKRVA
jgi:hypothetical protein